MRTTCLVATLITTSVAVACAGGGSAAAPPPAPAATPAPAPAATAVMEQAARAASAPTPEAVDLTGDYGVSTTYGGQAMNLTLSLAKADDGSIGGSIYIEEAGTIPFTSVTVTGTSVKAALTSPDGAAVSMAFTIEAGVLTGSWSSSAGDGGALHGRKM